MYVRVFLIIVGAVSAWYVPDEQNTHDINGDTVIEERNDEYISQNYKNIPYVYSDFSKTDKVVSIKTNQRFVKSTVKSNQENHEDSFNNMNNNENDQRLRTKAYTNEEYTTTEYIVQDVNTYTNRKKHKNKIESYPIKQGAITGPVYYQGTYYIGFIKGNEIKSKTENRRAIYNSQEKRRPETSFNIPVQNQQNQSTNNITNYAKKPISILKTVLIQPVSSEEPRKGIDIFPKTNSDNQIWVWGTEETSVTTTELGSLDNRAAFTGNQCPTGKAKIKGICVDRQ